LLYLLFTVGHRPDFLIVYVDQVPFSLYA